MTCRKIFGLRSQQLLDSPRFVNTFSIIKLKDASTGIIRAKTQLWRGDVDCIVNSFLLCCTSMRMSIQPIRQLSIFIGTNNIADFQITEYGVEAVDRRRESVILHGPLRYGGTSRKTEIDRRGKLLDSANGTPRHCLVQMLASQSGRRGNAPGTRSGSR